MPVATALRVYFAGTAPHGVVSVYLFGSHAVFVRTARLRLGDLRPFLDRTRRVKFEALGR